MGISEFIDKYYLLPIRAEAGYNFYNTLTYAIIALILLYVIFELIKHTEIKINFKFFVSIIPFIFFGSLIRTLVDRGYFFRRFWFISPGIYLLTTFLFLVALTASYWLAKSNHNILEVGDYWRICATIGTFLVAFALMSVISEIGLRNPLGLIMVIGVFVAISISSLIILEVFRVRWVHNKLAISALLAHLFDASATVIITKYFGGKEKHPLPRWLIEESGSEASFFVLKLIVLIPALYLIATQIEDKELQRFLFISIAVLGFAEGLRNLLSLIIA